MGILSGILKTEECSSDLRVIMDAINWCYLELRGYTTSTSSKILFCLEKLYCCVNISADITISLKDRETTTGFKVTNEVYTIITK